MAAVGVSQIGWKGVRSTMETEFLENPFSGLQIVSTVDECRLESILDQAAAQFAESQDLRWVYALGFGFWRLNRFVQAHQWLEKGEPAFSGDVTFQLMCGMVSRHLPDGFPSALKAYERAIRLDPIRADPYYNLGNLLLEVEPARAERTFCLSLALDASPAPVWHNHGISLNRMERFEESLLSFQTSIMLDPAVADVWCNLGLAYFGCQRFEQAHACFAHAITLDARHPASHINVGNALINLLQPDQALTYLEKGVELDQASSNSLWNLSLAYLLLGEFAKGWRYYEARFATENFKKFPIPVVGPQPNCLQECPGEGDPPLVIWTEQGLGDAIQFGRYVHLLRAAGVPVVLMTRKPLMRLFSDWFGCGDSVQEQPQQTNQNDRRSQIPMLSLPLLFRTELHSVPSATPYLTAPGPVPQHLRVDAPPGGLSVGLVWATNPDNKAMYHNKSLPLELLMPYLIDLIDLDLIDLHCLQFGADARQLDSWKGYERISE
jgi:tetratricopeptide (TPR) repeat protein